MKIPSWLNSLGLAIWTFLVAIGTIFLYSKFEKPQTVVNNDYGKVKNKGEGNSIQNEANTTVQNDNKKVKKKGILRKIFKKSRN